MFYVLILLLAIALMNYFDIRGKKKYKQFCYNLILVILILYAGLRYRIGGDTIAYLDSFYHLYPSIEEYDWKEFYIGKDPLYTLINSVVKSLGGRFYVVQIIHAAFVNILIFKYFKKHTPYIFTSVFFYLITFYFLYNTEILRASMSIVVALFANDFVLERKWCKAVILYFISCLFHAQAIVLILTPLLFCLRLNRKTIVLWCCLYYLSIIVSSSMEDFLQLVDLSEDINAKAVNYNEKGDMGTEGFTIITYLVGVLPNFFYSLYSLYYLRKKKYSGKVMNLEPILLVGLSFIVIETVISRANRFVDYYRIYFVLMYAELFVFLIKERIYSRRKYYQLKDVIFAPLFIILLYGLIKGEGWRYFPYSSVIEKSISDHREKERINGAAPNPNEY